MMYIEVTKTWKSGSLVPRLSPSSDNSVKLLRKGESLGTRLEEWHSTARFLFMWF